MAPAEAQVIARLLRPKAQADAQEKNVLGHIGQLRERYTRARKLQAVR